MRQDIAIGLVVSALIHAGVFFESQLFPGQPPSPKPAAAKPAIVVMDMPKIEPDDPPKIERSDEPAKPMDFAPPSQIDLPQIAPPNGFVQHLQPPPPEGLKTDANMMTIPETRNPPGLHGAPIFDLATLDQQPVARVKTPPQYPFEMRRAGIAGEVTVDFIVDSNGNVQNAYALRSSQREFELPAVQAVSKWKFKPGRKGGHNVNTHMQIPIVFSLNDE